MGFFFVAIDEPHSNDPIFVNLFVKLKVVAIDRDLNVIHQSQVHFDSQLPEFGYVNASARHDAHFIEMTLRQVSCLSVLDQVKSNSVVKCAVSLSRRHPTHLNSLLGVSDARSVRSWRFT